MFMLLNGWLFSKQIAESGKLVICRNETLGQKEGGLNHHHLGRAWECRTQPQLLRAQPQLLRLDRDCLQSVSFFDVAFQQLLIYKL